MSCGTNLVLEILIKVQKSYENHWFSTSLLLGKVSVVVRFEKSESLFCVRPGDFPFKIFFRSDSSSRKFIFLFIPFN